MKVTIIEGSPEELADYEARTGVIGQAHAAGKALERLEDPLATGGGQTIGGTDFEGRGHASVLHLRPGA